MVTKKKTNKVDTKVKKNQDDSKLFAFLAVLLSIIGFLIAYVAKKENKYVMYYAKQSLILFFGWIILSVLNMILMFIPVIGFMIYWVASLALIVLWIMGLIYSISGEMKPIPFVADFAKKFNL